jgi:hypothetical protein
VECRNDAERHDFFTEKNFTLQEITIILQVNADEIPVYFNILSNYTIDNVGVQSVIIKTSGNENMRV